MKRWRKPIYVIRDFNNQRKQPDLAEAVTVIRVLAFVIRSSEATTTMVLQRELKTASESPKVCVLFTLFVNCLILLHTLNV